MRYSCGIICSILLLLPLALSCQGDGGPGGLTTEAHNKLNTLYKIHPRLIIPAGEDSLLRKRLGSTHRQLWERYCADLPGKLERARNLSAEPGRGEGNLAADLAFAWRATGEDSLLTVARDYLLELAGLETWDPDYDLLHGHLLLGGALAYDWLYHELNRSERAMVAARLGDEAQAQYEQITENRAWYRTQYLQNHAHVNFTGMAYAAVALYGEDARAQKWLAACEDFFPHVFELSPSDGGSIEGLSYGNYAVEFCLFYAELARSVLGSDYYHSKWIENFPRYVLHSMLPNQSENEWAMNFGDSPRHGNYHGPEHLLFLIASRLNDPTAQWLGRHLIELNETGLASASWWALLWYDPNVGETSPSSFPAMHRFNEIGQVVSRTAWQDTAATMIAFKSGAFMGDSNAEEAVFDLGAAHGHPDAGSFQLYSHGRFLLIDPGYTYFKSTANHNTLLVKGQGQLGEGEVWFAGAESIVYGHRPRVLETLSTTGYDYMLADIAAAYHPALGLSKALRHLLFVKPDIVLLIDELALNDTGVLHSWPADTLELTGLLRQEGGYVVGSRGSAGAAFQGTAGEYTIGISYIDNYPGTGSYSLLVDGEKIYGWKNQVGGTDTHLELIDAVRLESGSKISVAADPMGRDSRIVKITAHSDRIRQERSVAWLAHFEPTVKLERKYTWIEADTGELIVDIHPLAPEHRSHDWGLHQVKGARQIEKTMRLKIEPSFTDSATTMMNMLYIRPRGSRPLQWVRAGITGRTATVRYHRDQRLHTIKLNLDTREITLEPKD